MKTAKENTKKYICENSESFAYYSGLGGVEFKKIEYGIEDYIYCVSNAWNGKKRHHKVKIYYDNKGDAYIKIYDYKIPLNECIKM